MRALIFQGLLFVNAFLHVQALGRIPKQERTSLLKSIRHAHVSMELQSDGLPGEQIVQFTANSSELGGVPPVSGLGEVSPGVLPIQGKAAQSDASHVLNVSAHSSGSADATPQNNASTGSLLLAMSEVASRITPHRSFRLNAYKLEKMEMPRHSLLFHFSAADILHRIIIVFVFVVLLALRAYFRYEEQNRSFILFRNMSTWLVMAACFLGWTAVDLGVDGAEDWTAGYIQELIFSLENIFIFYSVMESFGFPISRTFNLLRAVVVCQVIYQGILYMGLATCLQGLRCLPFVIGSWLIFIGWSALMAVHNKHHAGEHVADDGKASKDPPMLSFLRRCLKDRLIVDDGGLCCVPGIVPKDGRLGITISTFVFLSLCIADFLMEVDVSFAKIEEFENQFVGFTSSALAAFAVPELFLLARWLFERFYALHYAIALILILFGVQLLIEPIIEIPALVDCAIQMFVVLFSILISIVLPLPSHSKAESADDTTCLEKSGAAGDMLTGLKHGDDIGRKA